MRELTAILVIIAVIAGIFGLVYLNQAISERHNARAHLEYTRAQAEVMRSDARANEMRAAAQAFNTRITGAAQAGAITIGSVALAMLPGLITLVIIAIIGVAWLMRQSRYSLQYPPPHTYTTPPPRVIERQRIVFLLPESQIDQAKNQIIRAK